MKASNDLPRQALVNKLMKGKELPSNSLIGAGLDPTKSALTLRSAKHSRSKFAHCCTGFIKARFYSAAACTA